MRPAGNDKNFGYIVSTDQIKTTGEEAMAGIAVAVWAINFTRPLHSNQANIKISILLYFSCFFVILLYLYILS